MTFFASTNSCTDSGKREDLEETIAIVFGRGLLFFLGWLADGETGVPLEGAIGKETATNGKECIPIAILSSSRLHKAHRAAGRVGNHFHENDFVLFVNSGNEVLTLTTIIISVCSCFSKKFSSYYFLSPQAIDPAKYGRVFTLLRDYVKE